MTLQVMESWKDCRNRRINELLKEGYAIVRGKKSFWGNRDCDYR